MFSQKLNTLIILVGLMLLLLNASAQTNSGQEKENSPKAELRIEKGIAINPKPLVDFGDYLLENQSQNNLDLTKPFLIELESILTKNGKLDESRTKYTIADGDEDIVNAAKMAIRAFNDSGFLQFARNFRIENIQIKAVQDKNTFSAVVTSSLKSKELAKTIASGLKSVINISKLTVQDEDEKLILSKIKITSEDSQLIVEFKSPKTDFHAIVERLLIQSYRYR